MSSSLLPVRSRSVWIWGLLSVVPLWLLLINQLRLQWTANPQYSYGWVMPLLCLGLALRRLSDVGRFPESDGFHSKTSRQTSTSSSTTSTFDQRLAWLFAVCALLIFPLRLILEANPDWRTVDGLLAFNVVAMTLLVIYYCAGASWVRHLAFPICFILMAVPWPFLLEVPLIQGLTRATTAATIECVGWLGIPASQHGNVIEISTGLVGVNEACGGIRSFQSSLMISMFLGEFFRFGFRRRLGLVLASVTLAFFFNACRTTLMVTIASKKGIDSIERWHDPAGMTISLACVLGLWGLSFLLNRRHSKIQSMEAGRGSANASAPDSSEAIPDRYALRPWPGRLAVALLIWLVLVEVTVEGWYRAHESLAGKEPDWKLNWPPQEAGFHEVPVSEAAREILSYSEGHSGAWTSEHGVEWAMYYFRWAPGQIAAFGARGHTPQVCLTAAGKTLRPIADNRCPIEVNSLEFPFRRYEFEENGHEVYVFHCLWEETEPGAYFTANTSGMLRLRLESVLQGRRNLGQRSLELAVTGMSDLQTARDAVQQRLQKLITPVKTP